MQTKRRHVSDVTTIVNLTNLIIGIDDSFRFVFLIEHEDSFQRLSRRLTEYFLYNENTEAGTAPIGSTINHAAKSASYHYDN